MITKIDVRVLDTRELNFETTTINLTEADLETAEQLAYKLLESKGVGPVYRTVFGLKVTNLDEWLDTHYGRENFLRNSSLDAVLRSGAAKSSLKKYVQNSPLWLAPNANLRHLVESSDVKLVLELRMRIRPAELFALNYLDPNALKLIFAQIRHDFIQNDYDHHPDEKVQSLIIIDLVRHALEYNLDYKHVASDIKIHEFIPKQTSRLHLFIMNRCKFDKTSNLKIIYDKCGQDVVKAKILFIETFFNTVGTTYGSESYYPAIDISKTDQNQPIEVRARFCYENANCYIEYRKLSLEAAKMRQVSNGEWTKICDICSISHGSLRANSATLHHSKGSCIVSFVSTWHAQSFMSYLDGYYRTIKKCHFHFCRDITSPFLDHLKDIRSYGPATWEFAKSKLMQERRVGTFLVRHNLKVRDQYVIDVNLEDNIDLHLDIQWDRKENLYKLIGQTASNANIKISVKKDCDHYSNLKALVSDVQIYIDDARVYPPLQLKFWHTPNEFETCPNLLLSLRSEKLEELIQKDESILMNSLYELPKYLPPDMLILGSPITLNSKNRIRVDRGVLLGGRDVVVKGPLDYQLNGELPQAECLAFHNCQKAHKDIRLLETLKATQVRLADWTLIKYRTFAESIGIYVVHNSLVQEYFPLGTLDKFLAAKSDLTNSPKLAISTQIADALLYLQEKRIIHGKLRCHNIFIHKLQPLEIKVADPLGTFDAFEDQAFIAPEIFGTAKRPCVSTYDSSIDVWAFGTTLWQIYSGGQRPPAKCFANNTLLQPRDCPNKIWEIVESCWVIDRHRRAAPPTLFRDLEALCIWQRDIHRSGAMSRVAAPDCQMSSSTPAHIYTDQRSTTTTTTYMTAPTPTYVEQTQFRPNTRSGYERVIPGLMRAKKSNLVQMTTSFTDGESRLNEPPVNDVVACASVNTTSGLAEHLRAVTASTCPPERTVMQAPSDLIPNQSSYNLQPKPELRNVEYVIQRSWKDIFCDHVKDTSPHGYVPAQAAISGEFALPPPSPLSESCSDLSFDSIRLEIEVNRWHVNKEELKLGYELGRGANGRVMKGVLSRGPLDPLIVAVKCIDENHINDRSKFLDLRREFDILKNLNHENIVKMIGIVDERSMMLVMEYMPLGSLQTYIRTQTSLSLLPLQKYALDIASGMCYLETMRVVHRDLALRNILVERPDHVKICDFGLAQYLGSKDYYKLKNEKALPLKWYAPEVFDDWRFTTKTDVWSYGVVLWEIYSGGDSPHYSADYETLVEQLKHERLKQPKDCPQEIYDLMLIKCWAENPEDRTSFKLICEHLKQLQGATQSSNETF